MTIEELNDLVGVRCSCGGVLQVIPNHDILENRLRLGWTHCMRCHVENAIEEKSYLKDAMDVGQVVSVNGIYFQVKEII